MTRHLPARDRPLDIDRRLRAASIKFLVSLSGSSFLSSRPTLRAELVRQIRRGSHLQPLRDAPRSNPAFPPQTQADSFGPAGGRRFPTGFGLPASFGPLPAAARRDPGGFGPGPGGPGTRSAKAGDHLAADGQGLAPVGEAPEDSRYSQHAAVQWVAPAGRGSSGIVQWQAVSGSPS